MYLSQNVAKTTVSITCNEVSNCTLYTEKRPSLLSSFYLKGLLRNGATLTLCYRHARRLLETLHRYLNNVDKNRKYTSIQYDTNALYPFLRLTLASIALHQLHSSN